MSKPYIRNNTQAKDSGVVGAIAELAAANFFMEKGYHVYRSLSRTGTHDLIIVRKDLIKTIQVATGRKSKTSEALYHRKRISECKSDYLFVYHKENIEFIDIKSNEHVVVSRGEIIPDEIKNTYRPRMATEERVTRIGLGVFADLCKKHKVSAVKIDVWRRAFYVAYEGTKEAQRQAFFRAKTRLVRLNKIEVFDKTVSLKIQNLAVENAMFSHLLINKANNPNEQGVTKKLSHESTFNYLINLNTYGNGR